LLLLFVIGIIATYLYESKRYENVFFENTYINNIDVSYKTPEEVKEVIKDLCKEYEINVKSRDREDEVIKASDIGLMYVTGDEINGILAAQEPKKFYFVRNDKKEYDIPTVLDLDEEKLSKKCSLLSSFDDKTVTESTDAYLGDYNAVTSDFVIVPEKNGNKIKDKECAVEYIKNAILTMEPDVNLEDIAAKIYPVADICSDNADLVRDKENHDRFVKTKISFKDSDIVLDGSTIKEWLLIDESGNITLNENMLEDYVDSIAAHFDTVGTERHFKSWYGNDTTASGGTYGWLVDKQAEFNELKKLIPEGTITEREPMYSQRAAVHGDSDWGDTYVEVNLAKQHLFFVKNGELIEETDVVSGGLQRKAGTPTGVYSVFYKGRNAVLRGPRRADGTYEYESPVSYWMPFNKGIGLHDASWRGSFGGNIYRYNGSHGCVNLPKKKAKTIFENIDVGVPVIVYDDDFEIVKPEAETEKETETKAKSKEKPAAKTQPAPATQAATQPETQPEIQTEAQTEASGEVGPAFQPSTQADAGPGVQIQVTYNAENLPGEMQ